MTQHSQNGEVLFRAFMAGDVSRLTTTALPDEWSHMQPSYQQAWDNLAASLAREPATADVEREPDFKHLHGVDKLAHLMAWHHFGIDWAYLTNQSRTEITAACQAAFDWMNQSLAARVDALSRAAPSSGQSVTGDEH